MPRLTHDVDLANVVRVLVDLDEARLASMPSRIVLVDRNNGARTIRGLSLAKKRFVRCVELDVAAAGIAVDPIDLLFSCAAIVDDAWRDLGARLVVPVLARNDATTAVVNRAGSRRIRGDFFGLRGAQTLEVRADGIGAEAALPINRQYQCSFRIEPRRP